MKDHPSDPVYFLLVDDLEENLTSLEALLRRDGLVLLKARSGPEALELLLEYDIALALLDVQMPEMDGFELAELMRGNERTGRVPIIFITAGSADRKRRFRGYETGAVDFLLKPIEPDILRSKADVFFELYRQRQQLAQQRDALKDYADVLTRADNRKDEFLAVLSHELRNPLTPLTNGMELLRRSPRDEKTFEEIHAMMNRQVKHLVRLIDDLLDVSRISRGKIDLRRELVSVQTVLQSALEASRPTMESRGHTVVTDISENSLWLNADLTRMSQVITNLLNNAAKFTPKGGRIKLAALPEEKEIVISVSDNGMGIPPEKIHEIFELFTQVENKGVRSGDGLGIGLALARQLAEMHEGSISAESRGHGQGSTFTVRLPLQTDFLPSEKSPVKMPTESLALKVLVVDDNEPSANSTAQILAMLRHKAAVAYNGTQALTTAREFKPDVIILDIGMPDRNGYEVCSELRQDPLFKDTLLIALTGWGQESDRVKSREAGFNSHLTKPVDFKELASLIDGLRAP